MNNTGMSKINLQDIFRSLTIESQLLRVNTVGRPTVGTSLHEVMVDFVKQNPGSYIKWFHDYQHAAICHEDGYVLYAFYRMGSDPIQYMEDMVITLYKIMYEGEIKRIMDTGDDLTSMPNIYAFIIRIGNSITRYLCLRNEAHEKLDGMIHRHREGSDYKIKYVLNAYRKMYIVPFIACLYGTGLDCICSAHGTTKSERSLGETIRTFTMSAYFNSMHTCLIRMYSDEPVRVSPARVQAFRDEFGLKREVSDTHVIFYNCWRNKYSGHVLVEVYRKICEYLPKHLGTGMTMQINSLGFEIYYEGMLIAFGTKCISIMHRHLCSNNPSRFWIGETTGITGEHPNYYGFASTCEMLFINFTPRDDIKQHAVNVYTSLMAYIKENPKAILSYNYTSVDCTVCDLNTNKDIVKYTLGC